MRLLHVITSVNPEGGGPIEYVVQVGKALQKDGHISEIASLDDPSQPYVANCPLPVHALGPGKGNFGSSPHFTPWLAQHRKEYDAVIVNGLWQYGTLGTWRALHNTDTPYFVFPHGMLDPWFKKTYPLKHLKKTVYWLGAEAKVLRDARHVCFTCEEEKFLARESFRPYNVKEVVVSFGTAAPPAEPEKQRQAFLERFPHLEDKRNLLFLSRIHVKKGCDLLIEAFARVASQDKKLHLVMAGPDQTGWQAELEQLATKLNIADRITWTGMLRGDQKWGAYRASEAFVLPSHQENFGIVVAESLACGVPVLISNKVNIWREIEETHAGFVNADTTEDTVKTLQSWLSLSPAERAQMGKNALDCFERHFEIESVSRSLLHVVEKAISPNRSTK